MSAAPSIRITGARLATAERVAEATLLVHEGRLVDALPSEGTVVTVDLRDHLVFPGLVNAHDHLSLNAFRCPYEIPPQPNSYIWIEKFQPYLNDADFASIRRIPEPVRARHGGLKNALCGATTVIHHDPWSPAFDEPDFPVHVPRVGWCHSLGLAGRYGPTVADSYRATPEDVSWVVHLAEGTDDVAAGELTRLEALGALGMNTILVHGVGLTRADVARILEKHLGVVWCPTSNLFMLGKTLSPRRLCDAGRLLLGTDSRFTGARDLLSEMQQAVQSSDLMPQEVVALVTSRASRNLRLPTVGGLSVGQRADFVVLADTGGNPYELLLASSRADLRAVARGGLPLAASPDLVSWFEDADVPATPVRLDGRPKLVATSLLSSGASELENGLEPR